MADNHLFGQPGITNQLFSPYPDVSLLLWLYLQHHMQQPGWDFEAGQPSGQSQLQAPGDQQSLMKGREFIAPEILNRVPSRAYDPNELTDHPWFNPPPFSET